MHGGGRYCDNLLYLIQKLKFEEDGSLKNNNFYDNNLDYSNKLIEILWKITESSSIAKNDKTDEKKNTQGKVI